MTDGLTDGLAAAALEREHHEVNEQLAVYIASPAHGRAREPLIRAIQALRRHIFFEEEVLFPKLSRADLGATILVMLREHAQIWVKLDELERELDEGVDDRVTAKHCHELAVRLQHHNSKEERIVYPHADDELDPAAIATLTALLRSGELPAGWVCRKARTAATRPAQASA